jgi:hypothetical protein
MYLQYFAHHDRIRDRSGIALRLRLHQYDAAPCGSATNVHGARINTDLEMTVAWPLPEIPGSNCSWALACVVLLRKLCNMHPFAA